MEQIIHEDENVKVMLADFDGVKKWCMKKKAEVMREKALSIIEERTDIDRPLKDRLKAAIEKEHTKLMKEFGLE